MKTGSPSASVISSVFGIVAIPTLLLASSSYIWFNNMPLSLCSLWILSSFGFCYAFTGIMLGMIVILRKKNERIKWSVVGIAFGSIAIILWLGIRVLTIVIAILHGQ